MSTTEPEAQYVSAKCGEGHPMILKAECHFCEKEKMNKMYLEMLQLYKSLQLEKHGKLKIAELE